MAEGPGWLPGRQTAMEGRHVPYPAFRHALARTSTGSSFLRLDRNPWRDSRSGGRCRFGDNDRATQSAFGSVYIRNRRGGDPGEHHGRDHGRRRGRVPSSLLERPQRLGVRRLPLDRRSGRRSVCGCGTCPDHVIPELQERAGHGLRHHLRHPERRQHLPDR